MEAANYLLLLGVLIFFACKKEPSLKGQLRGTKLQADRMTNLKRQLILYLHGIPPKNSSNIGIIVRNFQFNPL
jgi:hypothetical protein